MRCESSVKKIAITDNSGQLTIQEKVRHLEHVPPPLLVFAACVIYRSKCAIC
jgi:hypothetical protein